MPSPAEFVRALLGGAYDHELVSIDISDAGDRTICLEQIWSERDRRRGHASRALDALCHAADRLGYAIVLEAHWLAYDTHSYSEDDVEGDRLDALNELKLGNEDLAAWYARRGFVETGRMDYDNPIMRREPRDP